MLTPEPEDRDLPGRKRIQTVRRASLQLATEDIQATTSALRAAQQRPGRRCAAPLGIAHSLRD
jgi:hypothetical protein